MICDTIRKPSAKRSRVHYCILNNNSYNRKTWYKVTITYLVQKLTE